MKQKRQIESNVGRMLFGVLLCSWIAVADADAATFSVFQACRSMLSDVGELVSHGLSGPDRIAVIKARLQYRRVETMLSAADPERFKKAIAYIESLEPFPKSGSPVLETELAKIVVEKAVAYQELGQFDRTIELYKEALTYPQMDRRIRFNIHRRLAKIYSDMGHYVDALRELEVADGLIANVWDVGMAVGVNHVWLGVLEGDQTKIERGIKELETLGDMQGLTAEDRRFIGEKAEEARKTLDGFRRDPVIRAFESVSIDELERLYDEVVTAVSVEYPEFDAVVEKTDALALRVARLADDSEVSDSISLRQNSNVRNMFHITFPIMDVRVRALAEVGARGEAGELAGRVVKLMEKYIAMNPDVANDLRIPFYWCYMTAIQLEKEARDPRVDHKLLDWYVENIDKIEPSARWQVYYHRAEALMNERAHPADLTAALNDLKTAARLVAETVPEENQIRIMSLLLQVEHQIEDEIIPTLN